MGWLHKYKTNLRKAQRYGLFKTHIGKASISNRNTEVWKSFKGITK